MVEAAVADDGAFAPIEVEDGGEGEVDAAGGQFGGEDVSDALGATLGFGGTLFVPDCAEGAHGGQAGEAFGEALDAAAFVVGGDDEGGGAQGFDLGGEAGELLRVLVVAPEEDDAADCGVEQALFFVFGEGVALDVGHDGAAREVLGHGGLSVWGAERRFLFFRRPVCFGGRLKRGLFQGEGEEEGVVAALDEEGDVAAGCGDGLAQAGFVGHFGLADGEDVVAAFEAGAFGRAFDAQDLQAAAAGFGLDGEGEAGIFEDEALALQSAAAAAGGGVAAAVVFVRAVEQDFLVEGLAAAPDGEGDFFAGGDGADHDGEVVGGADFFAVDGEDDVALLQAALGGGAVGQDLGDERAFGFGQAEGFGEVVVDFLDDDAEAAALDFAGGFELFGDVHGHVDGDGEGDAHEAAAAAVYLGVDADDLSVEVEQGAAGVAGVDGDVGLDEGGVVFVGQAAAFGGDDTGGDAVFKAEGRADGGHPFAGAQGFDVAGFDGGQAVGFDFEQGDVRLGVRADEFGGEFAFVVEGYFDVVHAADDVGVGEDVAVGADDEAGAEVLVFVVVGVLQLGGVGNEAAEEVVEGVVFGDGAVFAAAFAFALFGGPDVDHGRAFLLHQAGEVGQQHVDFALWGLRFDGFGEGLFLRALRGRGVVCAVFFAAGGEGEEDGEGEGGGFEGAGHVVFLLFVLAHQGFEAV